jgi:hypothetical protein
MRVNLGAEMVGVGPAVIKMRARRVADRGDPSMAFMIYDLRLMIF